MIRRLLCTTLTVSVFAFGLLFAGTGAAHAQEHGGYIDNLSDRNVISGWAYDPRYPHDNIVVSFMTDGEDIGKAPTRFRRTDVAQRIGAREFSGFRFHVPNRYLDGEPHAIRAFAVNQRTGVRIELANSPYRIQKYDPGVTGHVDAVRNGRVHGWAFDNADREMPIPILAYEQSYTEGRLLGVGMADRLRSDVGNVFDTSGNHGFAINLDFSHIDMGKTSFIAIYAIDRTHGLLKQVGKYVHQVGNSDR